MSFSISSFAKTVFALAGLYLACISSLCAAPWSFGVISDTQWDVPDDGKNPNTVAADIIRQVDEEFIAKGVKLVIAVGDTMDVCNKNSTDTRALYAQDLYNAGIAFYPLRGNHDAAAVDTGIEFARVYPQIGTGINNATPKDIDAAAIIPPEDLIENPPASKTGQTFVLGKNFSMPATNPIYHSVSYSFDYANARFVLLDQFDNSAHTKNSTITEQQEWISKCLSDPQHPQHGFVFGHKNLLGGGHKDNLFGDHKGTDPGDGDPAQQTEQNRFIATLAQNAVHYYICGHDHHHSVADVTSPDGKNTVRQVICASDSSKFYDPIPPFSPHEKSISLDLHKIGYYIFTVDGPRVTMDYYAVDVNHLLSGKNTISTTPKLTGNWKKLYSETYSLEAGK